MKFLWDEKDRFLIDWEEGSELFVDSDWYEYMDKIVFLVIIENFDEDKFEFLDNEDVKLEKFDRIFGFLDDFFLFSFGINKFFNKSVDRDDIFIIFLLLEFERLEYEILVFGLWGFIEMEKDNILVILFFVEFEWFEWEFG